MKETRYFFVPDASKQTELPADEALHATRVLRLTEGDEIMLMDGCGTFYEAVVTLASQRRCMYEIRQPLLQVPQWKGRVHLAVAPTKMMERMEWLAEKATEIGIDELSFLNCQFSERRSIKIPRVEKIVVSAVKQSRKAWMPVVNELESFLVFIQRHAVGKRYIAHCYEEIERTDFFDELAQVAADEEVLVMIGPEGDFSIDEVRMALDAGFVSVHLGKSRLRTETAALSAVMMMQLSKR